MNDEKLWKETFHLLNNDEEVILVVIINKVGSAPNVPGAKMLVSKDSLMGTVGGGISEYSLTEKALEMLQKNKKNIEVVLLEHTEDATEHSSGMICSGSQHFAFVPLDNTQIPIIQEIYNSFVKAQPGTLTISSQGLNLEVDKILQRKNSYTETENEWEYKENIGLQDRLIMVGGGHVSLALSRVMVTLGFHLTVIDNRKDIPTMTNNTFAHEKLVISFNDLLTYIPEGNNVYVVVMTFGHKSDELVLEKIISRNYKYIGMMASTFKKQQIFTSLEKRGISAELLERVHSPIGVQIKSDTPEEIAISIAAEIIAVKNES